MTKRSFFLLIASCFLVGSVLLGRMIWGSYTHFAKARLIEASQSPDAYRRHLQRSIAYYFPFNPWVKKSVAAFEHHARSVETQVSRDEALNIWHDLRSSLLVLRGAYQPFDETLERANDAITRLTPSKDARSSNAYRQRLSSPQAPDPLWVTVGLSGFVLWICFSMMMMLTGLSTQGRSIRPRFFWLFTSALSSFLLFCLGMVLA